MRLAAAAACFILGLPVASGAQTVTARDELADAIQNLKALHMNSAKVDWADLEARAQQGIAGKEQASDAYPWIRFVIGRLGEKHTNLVPAEIAQARRTGQRAGHTDPPPFLRPQGMVLDGNIGVLKLPRAIGSRQQDMDYAQASRDALAQFSAAHVCRILVDLRGNGGGSMAPMINGVNSILGQGPYGYWLSIQGGERAWIRQNSAVEYPTAATPQSPQPGYTMPVAVLIDGGTASAAESTAIAFQGRANTRFFGQPTAGFVTTNTTHTLPDGAMLAISAGWSTDRLHRPYKDSITPDEVTEPGPATLDRASAWLKQQRCDAVNDP